jgi:hypothetical protein
MTVLPGKNLLRPGYVAPRIFTVLRQLGVFHEPQTILGHQIRHAEPYPYHAFVCARVKAVTPPEAASVVVNTAATVTSFSTSLSRGSEVWKSEERLNK